MLSVQSLTTSIGDLTLANGLSFDLKPGQVTAILGPNGTGKSSLLKTLFGDIKPTSGDISFNGDHLSGQALSKWRNRFGYMPQDIHLDVNLTVIEVVLLGRLDALSLSLSEEVLKEAIRILDNIGLAELANRDVRTLSGGQRQMILFAQALMRKPEIMMLDEPVSALDLHYQHVLLEHLSYETVKQKYVTVMVLHDLNLAAQYADNLLVLKGGELVSVGHPTQVLTSSLIKDIYDVDANVIVDDSGRPFVRTLRSKVQRVA
ncbi:MULTISPECIES: ABC transporter ATP-binding protein [Vibrio]|uniref:ABC transporter ATP-binding protein n=1 Tax=Vibrio casei TaxID=673372 RepID=A0A368LJ00_9VIBR|nr:MULTISPECIES: ABC transporter ATP-binding protein [Vibrio]RCS70651.1 ABC transporter ATP-binding protein [Vibrio casei]SJN27066.1 Iron(III) dicitrate transport ATP-binding protein FecE (TC 3.A.1.14.1) [Vibrio casei]HBV76396.1 ABC transporter ATP-binding protein [Vibrio sp.]